MLIQIFKRRLVFFLLFKRDELSMSLRTEDQRFVLGDRMTWSEKIISGNIP